MKRYPRYYRLLVVLLIAVMGWTLLSCQGEESPAVPSETEMMLEDREVFITTAESYHYDQETYTGNIVIPQIHGLADSQVEAELNKAFLTYGKALIQRFEEDVTAMKSAGGGNLGIESTYRIKTDTPDFFAFDVYTVETVGSASTTHWFTTIDRETRNLVTLPDLFQPDADYISPISQYLREEMLRQNREENGTFWITGETDMDGFESIQREQPFYINEENQLVLCFAQYEIAPGVQGSPEFPIPFSVIQEIVAHSQIK